MAKNIVQFDPKVQINCKGMKPSLNDSPTSVEIQSESNFQKSKSTIRVDFVLEDSTFRKDDSKGIGQFKIISKWTLLLIPCSLI